MTRDERPLAAVPPWLWVALASLLAAQIGLHLIRGKVTAAARDLPPAPRLEALRLASLGEPAAIARLTMLYVQAFDLRGDNATPYQNLDYQRLVDWLRVILTLDPRSLYPLFSAARVYAENPHPDKVRRALEFVAEAFPQDPNRRWSTLAHAALLAKHRLHDLALARRFAAAIDQLTTDPAIPLWARQMEIFILEDMSELEAAKIMLGGLLASGNVRDPAELAFLRQRLAELERRSSP